MGVYRRVYQPFGQIAAGMTDEEWYAMGGTSQAIVPPGPQLPYRTDWPGVVGTAERLGLSAAQLATGAQPLDPGAGVMLPSEGPPEGISAPPPGTPGVLPAPPGPPWLLIGGAVALYFFVLK